MILDKIELFFIDYEYDTAMQMVYAPLRGHLDLICKEDIDDILRNSESFKRKGLVEFLNHKPAINIDNFILDSKRAVPALDLALTNNCNLRCIYCHAAAGDLHKRDAMSEAIIKALLGEYFNCVKNKKPGRVEIGFNGGGEPTYEMGLLEHAINEANRIAGDHGIKCEFTMSTNGYYGKKVREYIINNFKKVSLSLDGPEHIQNLHRPAKDGRGSFHRVYETAKYFYEKNYPFAFRLTISEFSMQYLEEIIKFFVKNFPHRSLKLEPLNPTGRGKSVINDKVKAPDKAAFSKKIVEIIDYARGKPLKILNSASTEYDIIRVAFCSNVGVPNWIVDTQGNIRACTRDNSPEIFVFGRYDEDRGQVVFSEEKINSFKKMSSIYYDECKDCFCKYHCAGDCPERRLSDKSDCNSIRKIGAHILSQKIYGNRNNKIVKTHLQ